MSKKPPLSPEEAALWRALTGDVEKLPEADYSEPESIENTEKPEHSDNAPIRETVLPERQAAQPSPQGQDMDRRTEERLRRGKLKIEATLDLHGLTQDEAHAALQSFIKAQHGRGARCLLVITGKGRKRRANSEDDPHWLAPRSGVLRERVPVWLQDNVLKPYILKAVPAQPRDGGGGALYVYLRRNRSL